MNTMLMLFLLPKLFFVKGAGWAILRILAWPPSRARFDRIVNGGNA